MQATVYVAPAESCGACANGVEELLLGATVNVDSGVEGLCCAVVAAWCSDRW